MKKQKQIKKINVPKYIIQGTTTVYLILMISIFPLFFDEYYLNIVLTKKNFFQSTDWITDSCIGTVCPCIPYGKKEYG